MVLSYYYKMCKNENILTANISSENPYLGSSKGFSLFTLN